jgi:mono/diheme cytochrome c family protein
VAHTNRKALLLGGMALSSLLVLTTAFAKPPKKAPPKKPTTTKSKVDIAAGKKIYLAQMCAACHKIGEEGGQGGPELTKFGAETKHDAKWIAAQIKNPKSHKEDSTMPPYEDKIKGKDLDNLVGYLLSLKGDAKK